MQGKVQTDLVLNLTAVEARQRDKLQELAGWFLIRTDQTGGVGEGGRREGEKPQESTFLLAVGVSTALLKQKKQWQTTLLDTGSRKNLLAQKSVEATTQHKPAQHTFVTVNSSCESV